MVWPPRAVFQIAAGRAAGRGVFYLVTNTLAWLQDAGYAKTLAGGIQALTIGHPEIHPTTWQMFRNTLLSGGLFTALFVAAEKLTAPAESSADKTAGARDDEESEESWRRNAGGSEGVKIGVISDTHNFLDPKIAGLFAGVNHILHAGDIGNASIVSELEEIAPVTAVYGNTDADLPFKETEITELAARKFLIHHIVNPSVLTDWLKEHIGRVQPQVVVFGHTHRTFCETIGGVLYLNPGSAGRPKFGLGRTVAILHCDEKEVRAEFLPL